MAQEILVGGFSYTREELKSPIFQLVKPGHICYGLSRKQANNLAEYVEKLIYKKLRTVTEKNDETISGYMSLLIEEKASEDDRQQLVKLRDEFNQCEKSEISLSEVYEKTLLYFNNEADELDIAFLSGFMKKYGYFRAEELKTDGKEFCEFINNAQIFFLDKIKFAREHIKKHVPITTNDRYSVFHVLDGTLY